MLHRERLKAEDRLQFQHVFAARLRPLTVISPGLHGHFELRPNQIQQRRKRNFTRIHHSARKAHVAKLNRKPQTIGHGLDAGG
jgi:hypothetical protein